MTDRQDKFAKEFIKTGRKEVAAKNAGYSKSYAEDHANKIFKNVGVKERINENIQIIRQFDSDIADGAEIMRFFTDVMRATLEFDELTSETPSPGISKPRLVSRPPNGNERIAAARELAKRILDVENTESKEDKIDVMLDIIKSTVEAVGGGNNEQST